jgi:hypothetical protein
MVYQFVREVASGMIMRVETKIKMKKGVEDTVLADIIVEVGVPLALEVGMIIAFLIISSPLMLNYCHKSLSYVTKKGVWGDGNMIMPHHL